MARKLTAFDKSRIELRDSFWPDAGDVVWNRREETGFVTVPRTLGLVCTLLKHMGRQNDPSRVYLALWLRQRDYGFVEIHDSEDLAAECGYYRGNRKVRSLHEALDQLQGLGFVRVVPKGPRKYGFVLILHPHDVVQRIRHETPKDIPDWWWSLFTLRVQEIKTVLRWSPPKKPATSDFNDLSDGLDTTNGDLPF